MRGPMSNDLRYAMARVATKYLRPMLILGMFVVVNCLGLIPSACPQQLTVSKHAASRLIDSDAKSILDQSSKALQSKDGPEDVACKVTLSLSGTVSSFDFPTPNEIDTPDDFKTVCSSPGYI